MKNDILNEAQDLQRQKREEVKVMRRYGRSLLTLLFVCLLLLRGEGGVLMLLKFFTKLHCR